MKVLVVADPDTCLAFALAGIATQPVQSGEEVSWILDHLERDKHGLILVTEALAAQNRKAIERVLLEPGGPLILEIPAAGAPPRTRARATERILSLLRR